MKASEFKLQLVYGINNLIDDYFGSNNIIDKFINSTLKIMVKQNTYKLDDILNLFADQNGDIDTNMMIDEYSKMIGENGVIFDIRDFIKNDAIKGMMPDKVLVLKTNDLRKILGDTRIVAS